MLVQRVPDQRVVPVMSRMYPWGDGSGHVGARKCSTRRGLRRWRRRQERELSIDLLHSVTGHGSKEQLKQAMQLRGIDPKIVSLVDQHRCASCEERKRPAPRRMSTLEVHPPRWKVMLADNAIWVHPKTKQRTVIAVYMDQCSRFMVAQIMVEHPTKHPNAQMYIRCFEEHWQQYFEKPEMLRFDAEGTWRSRELDESFGKLGVMMDPIPGDAHWHLSPLERAIGWLKECLSRLTGQDPDLPSSQAVAHAVSAWNNKETVRGFSPRQHALGQVPDPCGRMFETEVSSLPSSTMEVLEGEIDRSAKLRLEAEITFLKWQAEERLSRASNSKHRRIPEFIPTDRVLLAVRDPQAGARDQDPDKKQGWLYRTRPHPGTGNKAG